MLFGKYVNKYYLKYGIYFLIGILALIAVDYIQLKIPDYLGQIVNMFDPNAESIDKNAVYQIIFGVLTVAIVMFLGRVIWRFSIFHASTNIAASLRQEMFRKSERLSQFYFHTNKVGNIINWFTTDVDTIEEYFGWGTIKMVDAFFMSVLALVKMFLLNWTLSLIILIPVLLICLWGLFVSRLMKMKWNNRQKYTDNLYDFSQENFTGIRVIKAFVKEQQQLHAFNKVALKNKEVNIDFVKVNIICDILINVILATITCLILGFGGWFVYSGITGDPVVIFGQIIDLNAGELITYVTYFDFLIWPMMALGQIFAMYSRAKTSLNRVSAFLNQEEDVRSPIDALTIKNPKGNIKFNNLSFNYPDGLMPSLQNINCEIKAGETIGIVGKIGSGKTTLVNSLLRLYNLNENQILIDDIDIMKLDIKFVRDMIAYVPQDNFLFSDNIKNNISFSLDESNEDEVINAAKFADVHDNIINFKDGYNTISGERGVTLSGGQKQRISIARAFIKDAPIMIMDDSVSAVDIKTEETILKNIKEQRKGKTTLIVASRISTVKDLDKIMVLNDGKLEAFGNHEELLKTSKTYKKLEYLQELEDEVNGGDK